MDKTVMFAVAGSGKTTHLIKQLNLETRSLLITYTVNNQRNLRNKIIKKFGYFPENITLYTYFTFLYSFCFQPFLWKDIRPKGINWKPPPVWTLRKPRTSDIFYLDCRNMLYSNRIAKLLETKKVIDMVQARIEKYFDNLYIDEVQDFAGHDFNFLDRIAKSRVDILFVGDFYQHTFDTSRDGNVNNTLHDDISKYIDRFEKMGLSKDLETLQKSHRCSPTVCEFISKNLKIDMQSNRTDNTSIVFIGKLSDVREIHECPNTVKLFYQKHSNFSCYSRNWGDCKGEDHYNDVCVVLNKKTYKEYLNGNLAALSPKTKNKLYVACTRTRGNLYFVPEDLYKKVITN